MKWLVFLPFFLISCIEQPVTEFFSTSESARDRLRGRAQSQNLSDSSERCAESEQCKETCEDIYLKATDLDRCYDSQENQVKAVSEVFEVLISPDRLSDLNDIEVTDFAHFINIGYRGFLDLIDPVHRDEDRNQYWEDLHAYDDESAQLVLEWIANKERIARSILSKDDDLEIIRHLFCIAGRSVSENEQRQYICDLFEGADCADLFRSGSAHIGERTSTTHWLDESDSCHDNPASIYIGLTQGEYDHVDFSTYADSQDNDNAINIANDLIAHICQSDETCAQFYLCPTLSKYQGVELANTSVLDEDPCGLYKNALGL